jgi:regulatory protein
MRDDIKSKRLTPNQAFIKLQAYCAYRERSHKEVKDKLYAYGLFKTDVEQITSKLIEQNFLNEERYAMAYVTGKYNIKGWGKNRIERELKAHFISPYLIKKAMQQIGIDEYNEKLQKLAIKKWKMVRDKSDLKKMDKVLRYLVGKGYRLEESKNAVQELNRNKKSHT